MTSCILCKGRTIEISQFRELNNVTSDTKPYPNITSLTCCEVCGHVQKDVNEYFRQCVKQIYKDYEIFKLSGGVEQVMFSADGAESRSKILAKWLKDQISLDSSHSILDFGCGDCSALCSFAEIFPEAKLFGYEIEHMPRPKTNNLPNFKEIIVSDKFEPIRKFDFISLIHCLEHLENPKEALINIHNFLTDEGYIFIEVPDINKSEYDILIADHVSHFSLDMLIELVEAVGFEIVCSTSTAIAKELTILAKKSVPKAQNIKPNRSRFVKNIDYVSNLVNVHIKTISKCKSIIKDEKKIGIFGSSIAAMWLWGELKKGVSLFIDEDANKHGSTSEFDIISPQKVKEGYTVIVPMAQEVADKIVSKYSSNNKIYIAV